MVQTDVQSVPRPKPSGPESPFRVHARVVVAMLRREMSARYGQTSGGYFWAVAEPVGMIAIMSLAFAALGRKPDLGQSFIVFFASGFLSFNFYRMTASQLFGAIKSNSALLKYPNVTIYDALVARLIL
ncbi:MAG: sugar ABC transporter permease, partial [Pseudomonadota bacterium]